MIEYFQGGVGEASVWLMGGIDLLLIAVFICTMLRVCSRGVKVPACRDADPPLRAQK